MTLLRFLDLSGVAVFAVSGALAGGRKRLDLFGVAVVALVTAIGGGTVRDLLLGRLPVFWVNDPVHLVVIVGATAFTVMFTRWRIPKVNRLLAADALGLALFSVTGAQIAETVTGSWAVVLLMGSITAAGGGLVRDVLCAEIPLILRGGQLYATAAMAGAGVYLALQAAGAPPRVSGIAGILAVLALRAVSIVFDVSLPVYELKGQPPDPPPAP